MLNEIFEKLMHIDEGLKSARKNYLETEKIPEDVFYQLVASDPTDSKKYLEWMCREYVGTSRPLSVVELKDVVTDYHNLTQKKKLGPNERDIYKLSFDDVKRIGGEDRKTKAEIKKEVKYKDAEKVFEDDRLLILLIKSWEAAKLYGKGTRWCITQTNSPDMWYSEVVDNYVDMYFVIVKQDFEGQHEEDDVGLWDGFKKGEKFAVRVLPGCDFDVWSEEDHEISCYWETLDAFEKDLGVPEETFQEPCIDILCQRQYEDAYKYTLDSLRNDIEFLYSKKVPDWYIVPDLEHLPEHIPSDLLDRMVDDAYNKMVEEDYFEGVESTTEGERYDISDLEQVLVDLEYFVNADEYDKEKWIEHKRRRDLSGQMKLPFAD